MGKNFHVQLLKNDNIEVDFHGLEVKEHILSDKGISVIRLLKPNPDFAKKSTIKTGYWLFNEFIIAANKIITCSSVTTETFVREARLYRQHNESMRYFKNNEENKCLQLEINNSKAILLNRAECETISSKYFASKIIYHDRTDDRYSITEDKLMKLLEQYGYFND